MVTLNRYLYAWTLLVHLQVHNKCDAVVNIAISLTQFLSKREKYRASLCFLAIYLSISGKHFVQSFTMFRLRKGNILRTNTSFMLDFFFRKSLHGLLVVDLR